MLSISPSLHAPHPYGSCLAQVNNEGTSRCLSVVCTSVASLVTQSGATSSENIHLPIAPLAADPPGSRGE
eukprot:9849507-Alexandrium_andersonii.AAC.1